MDRPLPFGLRSTLKIFTAVADMIAWVFHRAGIQDQSRYLDDLIFSGATATNVAARPLSVAPIRGEWPLNFQLQCLQGHRVYFEILCGTKETLPHILFTI